MALSVIDNTGLSQTQIANAINMPTGSILQVVTTNLNTYISTSSTSITASSLSASITPQFSTSKILVLITMNGIINTSTTTGSCAETYLYRAGSFLSYIDNVSGYIPSAGNTLQQYYGALSYTYLDSPASTSALTYAVYWRLAGGSNGTIYLNNYVSGAGTTGSSITLMEIR